jgi:hypothetical protein
MILFSSARCDKNGMPEILALFEFISDERRDVGSRSREQLRTSFEPHDVAPGRTIRKLGWTNDRPCQRARADEFFYSTMLGINIPEDQRT